MISPGSVQHSSSFAMSRSGFPFVILERLLLQTMLCPKAEVMDGCLSNNMGAEAFYGIDLLTSLVAHN